MSIAVTIILYTALVFATSAIGALTGIGGGVVRKPVFDAMGDFSAAEIAFLNGITVLAMSLVSIVIQSKNYRFVGLIRHSRSESERSLKKSDAQSELVAADRAKFESGAAAEQASSRPVFDLKNLALLAVGSTAGGVGGELLFASCVKGFPDDTVKLVQNAVLLVLVTLVLLYMIFRSKIPTAHLAQPVWFMAAGLLLGALASFLGIGGGPMNLAVLMLMFSMTAKQAAFASLAVILVSQTAKLIVSAATGTILVVTAPLVLSAVGFLTIGAIAGGFIGSALSKKLSEKAVVLSFNALQIVMICVIIYNIVRAAG